MNAEEKRSTRSAQLIAATLALAALSAGCVDHGSPPGSPGQGPDTVAAPQPLILPEPEPAQPAPIDVPAPGLDDFRTPQPSRQGSLAGMSGHSR